MSAALTVILGIHYHLSNGSDLQTFERIYREKIRPVLTGLYKFPKISAVLHFSGSLWYWIERHHGELLMLIGDMVKKKQLELLSGGFHEPLMPIISYNDRLGHIEMLTTYLRKHFAKRTQGCYLPELAWDSSMPGILSSCNIAYAFLDEACFFDAGIKEKDLYKPFISEDKGKLVTIFPVSKHLAFGLEKNTDAMLENLLSGSEGRDRIVSVFPLCFNSTSTDEAVEASVFSFLSRLSVYENRIDFSLPSKLIKNLSPPQKIYLPQKAVKKVFVEQPRINYLYAKMTFVRALIDQMRGDKICKGRAYEELWKAQDYDLYCGSQWGTANDAAIRSAAYKSLLEAENMARSFNNFTPSLIAFDFDFDGIKEYLFQCEEINCFISETGARIFELDYLPGAWNYAGAASPDGKCYSFSDMLAPPDFSYSHIVNNNNSGVRLCGDECYEMTSMDRQRCKLCFRLPASSSSGGGGNFSGIEIEKTFSLKKNTLSVTYCISNKGKTEAEFAFIPELNMFFSDSGSSGLRIYSYNEYESFLKHGEKNAPNPIEGSSALTVLDAAAIDFQDIYSEVIINLSADTAFDAWILSGPAGKGLKPGDSGYQSNRIMICKRLKLPENAAYNVKFTLAFISAPTPNQYSL
jgi:alpha-amylase